MREKVCKPRKEDLILTKWGFKKSEFFFSIYSNTEN